MLSLWQNVQYAVSLIMRTLVIITVAPKHPTTLSKKEENILKRKKKNWKRIKRRKRVKKESKGKQKKQKEKVLCCG